jgi:carbon storage regulator
VGESLLLGADIEVEVIEISKSRVKLGVRAPRTISVTRREAAVIATENRAATEVTAGANVENIVRMLRNSIAGL